MTKDPEGKHRVFLARPFSIKTAPRSVNLRISLLHGLTSRREKERERKEERKLERQPIVSQVQIKRPTKDTRSLCFA